MVGRSEVRWVSTFDEKSRSSRPQKKIKKSSSVLFGLTSGSLLNGMSSIHSTLIYSDDYELNSLKLLELPPELLEEVTTNDSP